MDWFLFTVTTILFIALLIGFGSFFFAVKE